MVERASMEFVLVIMVIAVMLVLVNSISSLLLFANSYNYSLSLFINYINYIISCVHTVAVFADLLSVVLYTLI